MSFAPHPPARRNLLKNDDFTADREGHARGPSGVLLVSSSSSVRSRRWILRGARNRPLNTVDTVVQVGQMDT
jgi:hypothetical protein